MPDTKIINSTLNGEAISYFPDTLFVVEVGRHVKGRYTQRYEFIGSLSKAVFYFNCINIGRGYKKRLRMNSRILVKVAS